MQRSKVLSLDEVAKEWIPYRIDAVRGATWTMEMQTRVHGSEKMSISIRNKFEYDGYVGYFLQPMLEIGLVHARALLEFVGLYAKNGNLEQINRRRPNDIAIEHYSVDGRQLSMVTPTEICSYIDMPDVVVLWSLVGIIEQTNKNLAHVTTGEILNMAMHGQIRCALNALPDVIERCFYNELRLENPANQNLNRWTAINIDPKKNAQTSSSIHLIY